MPVQCIWKIAAALLIGEIGNFNGFLGYKLISMAHGSSECISVADKFSTEELQRDSQRQQVGF